jgi:hypothetical protein
MLFGVMDFTQGFYQAMLEETSRNLTAFWTHMGIFEWNRVPMGIKGAPTYFQRVMATQVLDGFIHAICELYIDDCIVFGSTEDEYMTRLEQVFQRFAEKGIILNPDKTKLGLDEVEYVGHLISVEGVKFTEEKLANVLSFPNRLCPGAHASQFRKITF